MNNIKVGSEVKGNTLEAQIVSSERPARKTVIFFVEDVDTSRRHATQLVTIELNKQGVEQLVSFLQKELLNEDQ